MEPKLLDSNLSLPCIYHLFSPCTLLNYLRMVLTSEDEYNDFKIQLSVYILCTAHV